MRHLIDTDSLIDAVKPKILEFKIFLVQLIKKTKIAIF
jgi:hypothetical protein